LFPALLSVAIAIAVGLLLVLRENIGIAPAAPDTGSTETWTPAPAETGPSVSLEIDYGNGASRKFSGFPWTEGMTVGDLMRLARAARPGITYEVKGKDANSLLVALDGVKGPGPGSWFWTYSVDDRPAESSFEVQPLADGQRVQWTFGELKEEN
jgi:hypothetical protein